MAGKTPVTLETLREQVLALAADVDRLRRAGGTGDGAPADLGERVEALAGELRELGQRFDNQVAELVASIADAVTADQLEALGAEVTRIADLLGESETPQGPVPVAWVDVGPEQARPMLADLDEWLRTVLAHYRAAQRLVPCWYRHPELVQELLDLRALWMMTYRNPEAAKAVWAADWHQRHLPHVQDVANELLRGCTATTHRPPEPSVWPVEEEALAGYVAWWSGDRVPEQEPSRPGDERRHTARR